MSVMVEPHERPPLSELAGNGKGIECPQCHCRDFRVVKTRPGDGVIGRRRECRHCGYRVTTIEA